MRKTHSFTHFFHCIRMASSDSALVVTQDGNLTVGIIVCFHFFGDSTTASIHLVENTTHGVRCVVGTENLGS